MSPYQPSTRILTGEVRVCDEPDAVRIGDDWYVAEALEEYHNTEVFVCWALSPAPITVADLVTANIMVASGLVDADYDVAYSEVTGYLWTDEEGKVGGHDLVAIFRAAKGSYAALVISKEPIDLTELAASNGVGEQ